MTKAPILFYSRAILTTLCTALIFITVAPKTVNAEDRTAGLKHDEKQDYSETYELLNLFGDVFERARSQYVDPISDKELVENAVSGMLASLDPHSSYLNEESFEDMQVSTRGSFGGLGIEVTMENGFVKVVSPIDDTPAFRAGIQAGDFITHIDDEAVIGLSLNDAVDKMRGKVGTKIHLTLRREGVPEDIKKQSRVIRSRSNPFVTTQKAKQAISALQPLTKTPKTAYLMP